VIAPSWWKGWFALRGILNPLFDAVMARDKRYVKLLQEADVDERVSGSGLAYDAMLLGLHRDPGRVTGGWCGEQPRA